MNASTEKQTIGFFDKGKGTTLINCSSEGFGIGLKAEGKDLIAVNFQSRGKKLSSEWYEKWWIKYLAFPLVAIVVGALILYKLGLSN